MEINKKVSTIFSTTLFALSLSGSAFAHHSLVGE